MTHSFFWRGGGGWGLDENILSAQLKPKKNSNTPIKNIFEKIL